MKKFFLTFTLLLFSASSAYANCESEGLNWSWYMNKSKTYAYFDFSNTSGKNFYISKLVLYSSNKEVVVSRKTRIHIKPYGKFNTDGSWALSIGNLNTQYIKSGSIFCEVTTAANANKKKNEPYISSGKKSGFKWWYLIFLIPVAGFIMNFFEEEGKKKKKEPQKQQNQNKKKTESELEETGPKMTGTAFFIDDKGHLITNFHVVSNSSNRLKIVHDGEEIKAKVIAKDETLDLALIKTNIKNENFIEISDKVLKKMQSIVAAGFPALHLSDDLKLTSGIISSLKGIGNNSALIQIDAALNPGNSGGPIIDKEKGHLAAVAVARMEGSHYQSINYGIKASRVKEFVESNNILLSKQNKKSKKIKKKDIGEILENSTVLIYH